jgi:hypothetical protein
MIPSNIDKIIEQVRERWSKILPIEDEKTRLGSWETPTFVPHLGIMAAINVMNLETYSGSSAEIVVVPIARLHEPTEALDELADKLALLTAQGVAVLLDKPIKESIVSQNLALVSYVEGMFDADGETTHRRQQALDWTNERFPAVAQRMKDVYGLRLPRYLATFAAFWRSLDELERKGMEHLGRRPGGIMVWFEERGLSRKTRDNLDPRLECRFRADPPELVTIMWGDSDGLHYGLWYDDPADPPTYIAHNYARDSAETWRDQEPTPLSVLLAQARERINNPYGDEPASLSVYAARAALDWFVEADTQALAEDPPAKRWLNADRIETLGTFGPALPPGAGSIRVGDTHQRLDAWRKIPARVRKWMDSAKRDCAAGKPAAALTFGLDIHWLDSDEYRKDGRELLLMAYEKLGRHAFAETLEVHYTHRDLGSVGVFLDEDEDEDDDETP